MEADSTLAIAVDEISPPPTEGEVSLIWEVVSTVPTGAEGGPSLFNNVWADCPCIHFILVGC